MDQSEHEQLLDVIIIGAGWSGLLACKYCLAEGLKTLALEGRDSLGGVWSFTEDRSCPGVMTTTETTSSRCITEISDFPMPVTYPDFPSHHDIIAYLKAYCARFDLERHIRLGQQVSSVQKIDGAWCVMLADGFRYNARNIVVCSGVHQHPNTVSDDAKFNRFAGEILHSSEVKAIPPDYAGKTFVVWGGGESASDVTLELSKVADRVYWCIPNGQWFVPKVVPNWPPFPSPLRKVVDHTSACAAPVVTHSWLLAFHQPVSAVDVRVQRPRSGGMANGRAVQPFFLQQEFRGACGCQKRRGDCQA